MNNNAWQKTSQTFIFVHMYGLLVFGMFFFLLQYKLHMQSFSHAAHTHHCAQR